MSKRTRVAAGPGSWLLGGSVALVLLAGMVPGAALAKFKDVTAEADATVSDTSPDTPNGTQSQAFLQSDAGGFGDQRIWLRFDLAGQIPPGATLSAATLRFYVFRADGSSDLPLEVVGVPDGWSEETLTWNVAEGLGVLDATPGAGDTASTTVLARQREFLWVEMDVLDFVAGERAGDQRVSLAVRPTLQDSSPGIGYRLDTREFGTVLAPRLRLEYTGDWPASADDVFIIHTNDMHSRLNTHEVDFPDADGEAPALEEAGGAPWVAATVMALKQQHAEALVLDAGDISEGNPLGDLRGNGGSVAYFQLLDRHLKALGGRGVDAVVVGNHDVREAAMLDNMRDPDGDGVFATPGDPDADPDDVPYLAVNLLNEGAAVPAPGAWPAANTFRPYITVDLAGGTRVGVLGYLTDDSAILTDQTEFLIDVKEATWSDDDPDTVDIKPWVEHLRTVEAVDIVVFLSHIGHRRLNATSQSLLGDTGDVAPPDVVVSGHWHTWTATAWQPSNLNYQTTNVEAASYGQYVGELRVTPEGRYVSATKHAVDVDDIVIPPSGPVRDVFDAMNGELTLLRAEYAALAPGDAEHDPCILVEAGILTEADVQAEFPGFTAGDNCPLDLVVGVSAVDLELDKDKWNTLSEFPWSGDNTAGEWITDGMVWKVRQLFGSDAAELAIQSGGGIRRDIAAGELTYREIYEAYPWDDDGMVRVQMTSAEIVEYIQGRFVGSSISSDWRVAATDGQIDAVEVDTDQDGTYDLTLDPDDVVTEFDVIISEYMYENDNWITESGGTNSDFQTIDPTPEYLAADGSISPTPAADPLEIRNSLIEYTAQFDAADPLQIRGPRYLLNTEVAGEFEAVVTMTADAETEPYFEAVFVRLLAPTAETVARRNLPGDEWGLDGLVNEDGSLNLDNRLRETLLYRSHLGFPDGWLQVGDILRINGEFGFFEGNHQFVDQDGILGAEEEFTILGHDPLLADADPQAKISDFFDQAHENHLVSFFAERTSDNTVRDAEGTEITVFREGGFFTSSVLLAGEDGDCIELTGVPTERADASDPDQVRRFRLRDSTFVSSDPQTCYPPASALAVSGPAEVGAVLTLTATAQDLNGVQGAGASNELLALDEAGLDANGSLDDGTDNWNTLQASLDGLDLDYASLIVEVRVDNNSGSENIFVDDLVLRDGATIVAAQRFDTLSSDDTETFDQFAQGSADIPLTNGASAYAGGAEGLGFATLWTDTRGNAGPVTPTSDTSDFIGVNRFTGANSPDVGPDGSPVADGTQQNFEFNDGDGRLALVFDPVDLSAASGARTLELAWWVNGETSYEGPDSFTVLVRDAAEGGGGEVIQGTVTSVAFYYSLDGGPAVLIAIDEDGSDGWSVDFVPDQAGSYEFFSVATDDDGNTERAPFYADATVEVAPVQQVPALPWLALAGLATALGAVGLRRRRAAPVAAGS